MLAAGAGNIVKL